MLTGPSENEEEYFVRMEFERRKQVELARQDRVAKEEREQQKALHYMKCPKCGMALVEIEYRSLKVDKCVGCLGIWLDPGEFEAVAKLERSTLNGLFAVFRR